ncbi:MAG: type VI secretion system lipoprotein TssJ [Candidatus Sedimenticola sp. (ex Thyasira tokunagai)]
MRSRYKLITGSLVLLSLLLVSCMTKEPPPPATLEMSILSSIHVNPNTLGKSSPIVIRYYELKSTAVFEATDFFDLTDPDKNILKNDLLGRDELEIHPGTEQTVQRELDNATQFIGIVAAYRDLEQSRWRAVLPITAHADNAFIIRLGETTITVSNPAEEKKSKTDGDNQSKFDF